MTTEKTDKLKGKNAFDMFPDIMGTAPRAKKSAEKAPTSRSRLDKTPKPASSHVTPPQPPDAALLLQGEKSGTTNTSDAQIALLLMEEGENKTMAKRAFETLGYLVESAASSQEAIEKMNMINVSAVALQTDFEGNRLADSQFHEHMKWLPMSRRRQIYYVLIGPGFHTLYDMEALVESANLVVNEKNIGKLLFILRKGFQEYDSLFGPYIAYLEEYGKK